LTTPGGCPAESEPDAPRSALGSIRVEQADLPPNVAIKPAPFPNAPLGFPDARERRPGRRDHKSRPAKLMTEQEAGIDGNRSFVS